MNEMLKQTYEITMMIVRGFIFLGDSIAKVTAIAAKFTLSGLGKLGAAAMGRGMGRARGRGGGIGRGRERGIGRG